MSLLKSYEGGRESHAHFVVKSLFEEYLYVEELFSDGIQVNLPIRIKQIISCFMIKSKCLYFPFFCGSNISRT